MGTTLRSYRRRLIAGFSTIAVAMVFITAGTTPGSATPSMAVADSTAPATSSYSAAAAAAAELPTRLRAIPPEYRRDEFGDSWPDLDDDGCSERQEVLQRDLESVTLDSDGCTVLSGVLDDPYTAQRIDFAHDRIGGDSQAVQIEHIVALSTSWSGGAYDWNGEQRITFANDPQLLLAVDGATNAAKGDDGPSDWLPPNDAYICPYALAYTTIASSYGLSVSVDDRAVLVDTLTDCET